MTKRKKRKVAAQPVAPPPPVPPKALSDYNAEFLLSMVEAKYEVPVARGETTNERIARLAALLEHEAQKNRTLIVEMKLMQDAHKAKVDAVYQEMAVSGYRLSNDETELLRNYVQVPTPVPPAPIQPVITRPWHHRLMFWRKP